VDDVDAAEAAAQSDEVAHVVAAMRALPPEQRDALVAVTLHGLSGAEYSQAADLPLGTVKTRIRLALRKLRDELGVHAP
jgi:RNA polymerase sigma-70 factor (ECF subfamily)